LVRYKNPSGSLQRFSVDAPKSPKSQVQVFGDKGGGGGISHTGLKVDGVRRSEGARGVQEETVEAWAGPLRLVKSGCGMTAQAQLVLDARAAAGRPFVHSSTHPPALRQRHGQGYYGLSLLLDSLLPSFLSIS